MRGTAVLLLFALYPGCGSKRPTEADFSVELAKKGNGYELLDQSRPIFTAEVLKWHDGHRAAVSITYDAAWGTNEEHHVATDAVIDRGLRMDLEVVSWTYQQPDKYPLVVKMRTELIPRGIHFFGHGHRHVDHDSLSFEEAYASFKLNFDLMKSWGLNPKAYAYPGSAGREMETQLANQQAGFICARGSTENPEEFYLCPGDTTEPDNWYYLPSVVMAKEFPYYIQSHEKVVPILDSTLVKTAWVILLYHAIGIPGGWGYYPLADFIQDLQTIGEGDFWSGNMDMVAAYVQERNAFALELASVSSHRGTREYGLLFKDGLDDEVYNQPLTIEFNFNPELKIEQISIEPPLDSSGSLPLQDNRLRLNVVPDEQVYSIKLE